MPVNGCSKISASSDGVKVLVFLLVIVAHPSLQRRVHCRKLEMQGGVLGKHAPANVNTLIKTRAAAIKQSPFAECLDQA